MVEYEDQEMFEGTIDENGQLVAKGTPEYLRLMEHAAPPMKARISRVDTDTQTIWFEPAYCPSSRQRKGK